MSIAETPFEARLLKLGFLMRPLRYVPPWSLSCIATSISNRGGELKPGSAHTSFNDGMPIDSGGDDGRYPQVQASEKPRQYFNLQRARLMWILPPYLSGSV